MNDKYLNYKKEIEKLLIKELRSIFEKNNIHSKLDNHNKKCLKKFLAK